MLSMSQCDVIMPRRAAMRRSAPRPCRAVPRRVAPPPRHAAPRYPAAPRRTALRSASAPRRGVLRAAASRRLQPPARRAALPRPRPLLFPASRLRRCGIPQRAAPRRAAALTRRPSHKPAQATQTICSRAAASAASPHAPPRGEPAPHRAANRLKSCRTAPSRAASRLKKRRVVPRREGAVHCIFTA